jgi:hypothetical protein
MRASPGLVPNVRTSSMRAGRIGSHGVSARRDLRETVALRPNDQVLLLLARDVEMDRGMNEHERDRARARRPAPRGPSQI